MSQISHSGANTTGQGEHSNSDMAESETSLNPSNIHRANAPKVEPMSNMDSSVQAKAKTHLRSMEISGYPSRTLTASERTNTGHDASSPAASPPENAFSDTASVDSDFEFFETGNVAGARGGADVQQELEVATSSFSSLGMSSLGNQRTQIIMPADTENVMRRAWSTVPRPRPGSAADLGAISLRELADAGAINVVTASRTIGPKRVTTWPAADLSTLLTRARDHRDVELPDLRLYWR
jgi:hypothetical protein